MPGREGSVPYVTITRWSPSLGDHAHPVAKIRMPSTSSSNIFLCEGGGQEKYVIFYFRFFRIFIMEKFSTIEGSDPPVSHHNLATVINSWPFLFLLNPWLLSHWSFVLKQSQMSYHFICKVSSKCLKTMTL